MSDPSSSRGLPPPPLSVDHLVARYLDKAGYTSTLKSFLSDAAISEASLAYTSPIDLREVVEAYDVTRLKEAALLHKIEVNQEEDDELTAEIEEDHIPKKLVGTLGTIHASNILAVSSYDLPTRTFDTGTASYISGSTPSLITTSADKTLKVTSVESEEVELIFENHKAAVLHVAVHPNQPRLLLTGSMDGSAKLIDVITRDVLQTFTHTKFVNKTAFSPSGSWLATCSYDRTIKLYSLVPRSSSPISNVHEFDPEEEEEDPLGKDVIDRWELRKIIETKSNPETLVFGPNGDWLAFTTRGDHHIKYIMLPSTSKPLRTPDHPNGAPEDAYELRRFNLNPNGDDHCSFSILALAVHPSQRFLALMTGDHSAVNSVSRVFLYPFLSAERKATLWTGSACDQFSCPRMAWFPSGKAFAVTSDDGIVRIIDLQGRVRSSILAHGKHPLTHVRSEAIRDVCVVPGTKEGGDVGARVYSCGFDQTVRILG